MITERAKRIAEAIQKECSGDITLDEVISDTLSGAETWLTAIAHYFNEHFKIGGVVTHESTMWMMVDTLISNLSPREEIPTMLKWYITRYEQYCKTNWELTTILLDKIKDIGGKEALEQLANDEKFKGYYDELSHFERILNARLVSDNLECLEAQIWKEVSLAKDNND